MTEQLHAAACTGLSAAAKSLSDYWHGLKGERALPRRKDLVLEDIVAHLGNLIVAEVVYPPDPSGSLDFRYRLVGSRIEPFLTRPTTGKLVSKVHGPKETSKIYGSYVKAVRTGEPVFAEVTYVGHDEFVTGTREFYLPFDTGEARVGQVFVLLEFQWRALH